MDLRKQLRQLLILKQLKELKVLMQKKEKKSERRYWVNPFLQRREMHSLEAHLLKDILWNEEKEFQNFCRMDLLQFEELLLLTDSTIKKQDTPMRFAITSRTRLAITLRFIACGDSYRSLEFLTRVSRKTISVFVPEVLNAIYKALNRDHLKCPSTENEWKAVSKGFDKLWQFPHTVGAIDGKHIQIKKPDNSHSDFYNYKGFSSIVLLAVVDANSKFLYIDVGGNGRCSDVVVFKESSLFQAMNSGKLNLPKYEPLPGQINKTPFFFIGDDIFALDRHLMKAYNRNINLTTPQEIFNYRLSRARMTVEMAFGRLANRFRIFLRPIEVRLDTCDLIVKTCCVLHNYLTKPRTDLTYDEQELVAPEFFNAMRPLPIQEQYTARFANEYRENVKRYCVTEGDVPFQWGKIKKQTANPVCVTLE